MFNLIKKSKKYVFMNPRKLISIFLVLAGNILSSIFDKIDNNSLSSKFTYFLMRNKAIFFEVNNKVKTSNKKEVNLFIKKGWKKINSLDKSLILKLTRLFVKNSSDKKLNSLTELIKHYQRNGTFRSERIIVKDPDILIEIFNSLEIINFVSEITNLDVNKIAFLATIDATISSNRIVQDSELRDKALEFHRDFDGFNFYKAFIYLNDITSNNGPHEFIEGSHKNLPFHLKLIRRYNLEQIVSSIPNFKLKQFTGLKGSGFIENTSGFHRGTLPTENYRLLLTIVFSEKKFVEKTCNIEGFHYFEDNSLQTL